MPIPTPPSPKTHPTRGVPPIVWTGFTGICGGQHVTAKEFNNFLYLCHSATPSCRGSSARWGKRQQSTSDGGDGQHDSNGTAIAMDGVTAMRRQCNGSSSGVATAGSKAAASAARGWRRQRGGGRGGAGCSTAVAGSRVAGQRRWWQHGNNSGSVASNLRRCAAINSAATKPMTPLLSRFSCHHCQCCLHFYCCRCLHHQCRYAAAALPPLPTATLPTTAALPPLSPRRRRRRRRHAAAAAAMLPLPPLPTCCQQQRRH